MAEEDEEGGAVFYTVILDKDEDNGKYICTCVCVWGGGGEREKERERDAGESDEVPVHFPRFTKHFHAAASRSDGFSSFPAGC